MGGPGNGYRPSDGHQRGNDKIINRNTAGRSNDTAGGRSRTFSLSDGRRRGPMECSLTQIPRAHAGGGGGRSLHPCPWTPAMTRFSHSHD